MRLVSTLLWIVLFVLLLVFSIENTGNVELRLFGQRMNAPLIVLLLAFFTLGAVMGLLASVPSWFRGRREIARLTRELESGGRPAEARVRPVAADVPAPLETVAR